MISRFTAVPQPLPRAFRRQEQAEDDAKIARIVRDAESQIGGKAGGDEGRLRGLPAVGRGSASEIRGTRPDRLRCVRD